MRLEAVQRLNALLKLVSLSLLGLLLMPIAALAYSGPGGGTSQSSYRITTCTQLASISSALSAHYILNNDLNCNGVTFTSIGSDFTGTLDGNNHTITNINFAGCGIFCSTGTGAVIKNLKLTDGTLTGSSGDDLGSIVGAVNGTTTITNVHSNIDIHTNDYSYNGGLVGILEPGRTMYLSKSSYSGTITADGYDTYIGGVVGSLYSSSLGTVSDTYANATITVSASSDLMWVGGLAGNADGPSMTNLYAAGSITSASSHSVSAGGLVGVGDPTITDSFADVAISGTYTYLGGAVAAGSTNYTSLYFDEYAAGTTDCSGSSTTCTGVNAANSTPNYFKNNHTNAPLNGWDFSSIWSITSTYPQLASEGSFDVNSNIPNSGDANGDGINDAYQSNIKSIANNNNVWVTVEIPSDSDCTVDDITSISPATGSGIAFQTATLTGFKVYCVSSGTTVPITVIYDKQYNTDDSLLKQYNTDTGSYTTVNGAVFGERSVGGITKTTVTYSVTDGGSYDIDGSTDGVITDPIGFGNLTTVSSGSLSKTGQTALPIPILLGMFTASSLLLAITIRELFGEKTH